MATTNLFSDGIFDIPQDILLRCVTEFLRKRDQYNLFSLCSAWTPLLHQSRKIHINNHAVDIYSPMDLFTNQTHNLEQFLESETRRLKLLRICGLNLDGVAHPPYRPLRLTLNLDELVKSSALIQQYVHFIESITVRLKGSEPEKYCWDISDTILRSPTEVTLACYLKSTLLPKERVMVTTLQRMWDVAQHVSRKLISGRYLEESYFDVESASASFSSLRGVRRLVWKGDGSMFLEMSPDCEARLHSVVLDGCKELLDLTCLQGIPEVGLLRCVGVRDLSPLAHNDSVVIDGCVGIDISMLGSVRKLVLNNCDKTTVYPVPSVGKGQEWEIDSLLISDVSGFANLEKLTLRDCVKVADISMLGNVKYLYVRNGHSLICDEQFPVPLGRNQQWTFDMGGVAYGRFKGLHTLQLNDFSLPYESMRFLYEEDTELISNISVNTLIIPCGTRISFGDNVDIVDLDIHMGQNDPLVLTLSASARANLHTLCIHDHNYLLEAEFSKESLVDMGVLLVNQDQTRVVLTASGYPQRPITMVFNNSSLRTAVWLWCKDEERAIELFGYIDSWDVSQVTDMSALFYEKGLFDSNINSWDVSNVTEMNAMFSKAHSFNQPLDSWNVTKVTNIAGMFLDAYAFNQPLDSWDVSNVTTMNGVFSEAADFNQPLNDWNVSNVEDMTSMFCRAESFNQPLDSWDVSKVTNMSFMFCEAFSFNQPINTWNVSNVNDMSQMFKEASFFNQPLDSWGVARGWENDDIFDGAASFNQAPIHWSSFDGCGCDSDSDKR